MKKIYCIQLIPVCNPHRFEGTLAEAKAFADANMQYTTKDIIISDVNGNEICRRVWNLVGIDREITVPTGGIRFMDGYYSAWM